MIQRHPTLRSQFLLIVIGVVVIPLGIVAVWLTSTGVRSGEALLNHHLEQSADQFAAAINARWEFRQGILLFVAGSDVAIEIATRGSASEAESAFLNSALQPERPKILRVAIADTAGSVIWRSTGQGGAEPARGAEVNDANPMTYTVSFLIPPDSGQRRMGSVTASILLSGMIPPDSARPVIPGARLGVRAIDGGQTLLPLHGDMQFTSSGRATIGSESWLARTRRLDEARLEIVLAAPLAPYVGPFRDAGRVGLIALLVVGCIALTLTVVLTTRVTRPLRDLANAAEAVSRGNLDSQVATGGPIEVRRVGGAFNVMVESLRSTLDTLSQKSAMIAVGEFATALSHDIRNALTSIKVDVERTVHRPMDESQSTAVLQRVLNNVARLDSLVSGALRLARGRNTTLTDIDLAQPARAAAEIVAGAFAAVPATLRLQVPDSPTVVRGDAIALQQLLANLLFNAAQAVRPGGEASLKVVRDNGAVIVEISDNGIGMDEKQLERLQQPFQSTKARGTGLGIPISRQIATAHGGELHVTSEPGAGTTVRLRIPVTQ